MRLTFIGADHEVTGSCHYLNVGETRLLVDCGMEQGINVYENAPLPIPYSDIDYVVLTHAHIDHAGLLPLIYARGFRGKIIATTATTDLCNIMLKDSAHIQETEAEWKNRKARRAGRPEEPPLYEMNDALGVLKLFEAHDYQERFELSKNVTVRFTDAGHLLGSSSVELWLNEEGIEKKIVFSGDIGNDKKPLIRDPEYISEADYVVMECTYGDRKHEKGVDHVPELTKIIQDTLDRGGNVVIPAFAVGRTQELLYFIRRIKEEKLVHGHDGFEVYVDSPLAIEATNVFKENMTDCYDEETKELVERGVNPISFPGLKLSITSDESVNINFDTKPKVIISAAGMCDAGRIRHHLKHNLWRPECSVVFAGYQAVGTLGRALQDGSGTVRLFGETIDVKAHIETMKGISSHADKDGLLRWISSFSPKPKQVFMVHGDGVVCDIFAEMLKNEHGIQADAPFSGSIYDLVHGEWLIRTEGRPIEKKEEPSRKATGAYARLLAAGERLLHVIRNSEGSANKDLGKFADQINSLCDKWDR